MKKILYQVSILVLLFLIPFSFNAQVVENTTSAQWLHWDDGDNEDSWGFFISAETYDVCSKWDPAHIAAYDGWEITKIKFFVMNTNPSITIKFWEGEGPDPTETYSEPVPVFWDDAWTEIELATPVTIDASQELWAGYQVITPFGMAVTSTDNGPAIDGYGNIYKWNGAWYSNPLNHNIQIYIEPSIHAFFTVDSTEFCSPYTVAYTDTSTNATSWNWTFEGGVPATSTDQNPAITYNTPGNYDAKLIVSDGISFDTLVKSNYISVSETPGMANTPTGDTATCGATSVIYTTDSVPYATDYIWLLSPANAGTLTNVGSTATLQTSASWTGDYTLDVQATNLCGDGIWSNSLACSLYPILQIYDLSDGGDYCEGETGIEITQDGSDVGVKYELFFDGETTGTIVDGDGGEISYGFFTEEGSYSANGYNDGCFEYMGGVAYVVILLVPGQSDVPSGDTIVCDGETVDYTCDLLDESDNILWTLTPESAGSIIGAGENIQIQWNIDFEGEAQLTTVQSSICGTGDESEPLEIECSIIPTPIVTGPILVCDDTEAQYSTVFNEGSTYLWTVIGGDIINGNDTHEISILWGPPGSGTVDLVESQGELCIGIAETLEVVVDECTGMDNSIDSKLTVFPNPTQDLITIDSPVEIKHLKLFDITGKVVLMKSIDKFSVQLNTSSIEPGIYLLLIDVGGHDVKKRIIIK